MILDQVVGALVVNMALVARHRPEGRPSTDRGGGIESLSFEKVQHGLARHDKHIQMSKINGPARGYVAMGRTLKILVRPAPHEHEVMGRAWSTLFLKKYEKLH